MSFQNVDLFRDDEELEPLTARKSLSDDFPNFMENSIYAGPRVYRGENALFSPRMCKIALVLCAFTCCGVAVIYSPMVAAARLNAAASAVASFAAANATALNWGKDCYTACTGSGLCPDFCGPGNACCRFGSAQDPPECQGILAWGSLSYHTCIVPVSPVYKVLSAPVENVDNWGKDCWIACKNQTGYCRGFCGRGNACCQWNAPAQPSECQGILNWGAKKRHTCVSPADPVYQVAREPPEGTQVFNWGESCLSACNFTGFCPSFCGVGNACCKWNAGWQAAECSGILAWGSKEAHTCVAPVHERFRIGLAPPELFNWGEECAQICGGAGYCESHCGIGNACCKWESVDDPPECLGITEWGAKDKYTCVKPANPAYQVVLSPPNGTEVFNWGSHCLEPCNDVAGYCEEFCGRGNACCRFGNFFDPPECRLITQYGAKDRYTCVAPVDRNYVVAKSPYGVEVTNWGADCYAPCGETGGACPSFCGVGNACCRYGSTEDPLECKGIQRWGSKVRHTCVTPVAPYLYVNHFAEDCWKPCNGSGFCEDWCGSGNACCMFGRAEDPHECKGVSYWPTWSYHTCVKAAGQFLGVPVAPPPGSCVPGEVHDVDGNCVKSSTPALMMFYTYYATNDFWPTVKNANLGNLGGVLWQLHNDVVNTCPRRDNINRIIRYVVTVKNPDALFQATKMQFGAFVNFRDGVCQSSKTTCEAATKTYGQVVGCNRQDTKGLDMANYPDPVLFSFPGGIGLGGECAAPDGEPSCTWKTEYAGEVRIDELSGIADSYLFCQSGNIEYNKTLDKGIGTKFWNHRINATWSQRRVEYTRELFALKYPNYPTDIGQPECDSVPWDDS